MPSPDVDLTFAERVQRRLASSTNSAPRVVFDPAIVDPGSPALMIDLPPEPSWMPPFRPGSRNFVAALDPNAAREVVDLLASVVDLVPDVTISVVVPEGTTPPAVDHPRIVLTAPGELPEVSGGLIDAWADGGRAVLADAAAAGLPIITTNRPASASLTHGLDAIVVDRRPDELGWAIRHLLADPVHAERVARTGRRSAASRTWASFDAIMADLAAGSPDEPRKRVAIVNTFAVHQPVNGGQRRLRYLASELARVADVEILVLSQHATSLTQRLIAPGLSQIEVPRSDDQKAAENRVFEILGEPTDDVTAADLARTTPAWSRTLDERLRGVDLLVSCHPYLAPTIPELQGVAFVYDSYNAETSFKRSVLADDENGRWLLDATERAERNATERADLIVACTRADLDAIRSLDARPHDGVVVSNGVDTAALPFAEEDDRRRARWELLDLAGVDPFSNRPIATFIGSSHGPNRSAAELLIAAARKRPDWLFLLAGSHTSAFAEGSEPMPDNVTLIPVFDEGLLWPLIAGANVATNPMVSGGGSNLKIFDYLAVGSPVLATPTGARGLDDPTSLVELVDPTPEAVVAGLDRLADPDSAPLVAQRSRAGRAYVEAGFSWPALGRQWALALGGLVGGWTGPERPRVDTAIEPTLLETPPLSTDPTVAAMQLIGVAATGGRPTDRKITMDPAFREHLRKAKANKNVGRELPPDARLAVPKRALIRAGHALSNEQVVYNEASLAAIERLMSVINDLQRDQLALTERLEATEAALAERGARSSEAPPMTTLDQTPDLDAFYEAFEDAYRGDSEAVARSTAHYLDRIAEVPDGPAVDIGCGRGEWLGLLQQSGRPARGFDTNAVAVERCVAAGLDAVHSDGIAHLETVEPGSVAVVSAFHVIEHLQFVDLHRLAAASHRALMAGGKLLLETPNCLNLQVGASSFWLDPTHISPVHPEQLRFLLSHVGFGEVDVFGIHPDEGSTPTDLDPDPARNGLLSEFHRLVFGSVDLVAVATKS